MAYEDRLRAMLAELRSSDEVDVVSASEGSVRDYLGSAEQVVRMLAETNDVHLAPGVERCLHLLGEFSGHWRLADDSAAGAGEFALGNLYEAIVLGPPALAPVEASEDSPELIASFRVIDDQPRGGTGTLVALSVEPSGSAETIWYYHSARGAVRLDLDYCGYLDALVVTKGFYYWQYLFADVTLSEARYADTARWLARGLGVLPRLFPDHDYDELGERLRQRTAGGAR